MTESETGFWNRTTKTIGSILGTLALIVGIWVGIESIPEKPDLVAHVSRSKFELPPQTEAFRKHVRDALEPDAIASVLAETGKRGPINWNSIDREASASAISEELLKHLALHQQDSGNWLEGIVHAKVENLGDAPGVGVTLRIPGTKVAVISSTDAATQTIEDTTSLELGDIKVGGEVTVYAWTDASLSLFDSIELVHTKGDGEVLLSDDPSFVTFARNNHLPQLAVFAMLILGLIGYLVYHVKQNHF